MRNIFFYIVQKYKIEVKLIQKTLKKIFKYFELSDNMKIKFIICPSTPKETTLLYSHSDRGPFY